MNKKTKEIIYRDTKGERWRFVRESKLSGFWLMVRVKDGHRMFIKAKDLTDDIMP